MEIAVFVLGVLFEKMRPDLWLRRWWANLPLRSPAVLAGIPSVRVPVPVALAGVDARRLLLRPSMLFAGYVLYRIFSPSLPADDAYEGVNRLVGLSTALVGLMVAAVVASVAGRDRGVELVEALPGDGRSRVLSWVALLSVLAVLEYGLLCLLRYGRDLPSYAQLLPDAWELAQGPIMLLGGGLLGLLLARILPAWVATPAVVILGILWVGVLTGLNNSTMMLAPVVEWIEYHEDGRVIVEPGSFAWHNGYLLGFCVLGVVAALLWESGSRRALIALGSAAAVFTAVAGALALP